MRIEYDKVKEFILYLGFDANDVTRVEITPTEVVVSTFKRNSDGSLQLDTFGPALQSHYYDIYRWGKM